MPVLDELADRLVAQGVGTVGSNILKGSNAVIPTGDGPYITLIETGGTAPTRIHNHVGAHTQRPTVQISVRAKSYKVARDKCVEAYNALDGVFNTLLGTTFYQRITARQEPTDLGRDENGRPMIVFNVEIEKTPS